MICNRAYVAAKFLTPQFFSYLVEILLIFIFHHRDIWEHLRLDFGLNHVCVPEKLPSFVAKLLEIHQTH